jgi:hypothetical protein
MRCDYLLRGLDPAGVCPECGVPVVQTIDDLLRRARREPRAWPQHPPLHELGPARLRLAAAGTVLLALVFLGGWLYCEMKAARNWYGPSVDPDYLLVALGGIFCLGAWMLSAVGRPHPQLRVWRDARVWMWLSAWGAPAATLLALWAEYVPWYQYHQASGLAGWPALLIIPAAFAAFMHLGYLMTGSRLSALPTCCRAAAVMGTLCVSAFVLRWPPSARREGRQGPHELLAFPPFWPLIVAFYVYPLAVLLTCVYVLLRSARRRRSRSAG